jgi:hypothetical protein
MNSNRRDNSTHHHDGYIEVTEVVVDDTTQFELEEIRSSKSMRPEGLSPIILDAQNRITGGYNQLILALELGFSVVPFVRIKPKQSLFEKSEFKIRGTP